MPRHVSGSSPTGEGHTDFDGADASLQIQRAGNGLAGKLGLGDVRQERPRINIDGVAARGRQDGDACPLQPLSQIPCGGYAILQVVLQQHLPTLTGKNLLSEFAGPGKDG